MNLFKLSYHKPHKLLLPITFVRNDFQVMFCFVFITNASTSSCDPFLFLALVNPDNNDFESRKKSMNFAADDFLF